MSRPLLDLGRKSRLGSAGLARPLHFSNLVAIGCRVLHGHEIGRSEIEIPGQARADADSE